MTVPHIRIGGFAEEMETVPFSSVAKPYFVSNKLIHHQNLLSLSYGQIVRKDIKANKGLLPASFDTYQVIDKGIIVFRFTDLQNDKKSLRVAIAKEEGIISPAYVCVKCENVLPEYLYLQLYAYDLRKVFYSMGDGLRQTLSYDDIKGLIVHIPSKQEQEAIVDYFKTLDSLLNATELKLITLKQIRSACQASMFPQEGEKIPRLRFKGFENDWERIKLGELCQKVTRKAPKSSSAPIMMISASNGFINQDSKYSFDNAGQSLANYTLLYRGELAYNHGASKTRKYGSCFELNEDSARVPFVYHTFSLKEENSSFFAYYLNSGVFDSELRKIVSSTARMDGLLNISYDSYMELDVFKPSIKEQEQIASFFRAIDNTIILQEIKLNKLKQIKASCLDTLFV